MQAIQFIHRWVLSPMETLTHPDGTITTQAIAAEYCLKAPLIPRILEGMSLCWCEMTQHQWEAAQQDDRIVVLHSLHSRKPVHPRVSSHFLNYHVETTHTTHDVLEALQESMNEPGYLSKD